MSKDGKDRRKSRQEDYEDTIATRIDYRGNNMLMMTSELVTSYSGQDPTHSAARWVQDIEDNAEIFGWTPLQQLLVARRSLTGTAALWLRAERLFKTWDDLKTAIIKEFPDSVEVKTIHKMMSTRKKKDNESCLDYMLIMKELGKRGKMPDYVAIKYIVEGIRDHETNKIMLYGVTTYMELKEKLRIYESVKNKLDEQRRRTEVLIPQRKDMRNRCFSCGEISHTSAYCPQKDKGMKCFKCNEFGHIASSCRRLGETAAPEHPRNSGRLHSTNFGNPLYSAQENERPQQSTDMKLKRTMFGRLMTSENEASTHSLNENAECNVHHHGGVQTSTSMSKADDNNGREFMQIVNKSGKGTCKPVKIITTCGLNVKAFIDTGSEVNIISWKCYEAMGQPKSVKDNSVLTGFGHSKVKSLGKCNLEFIFDEQHFDGGFHIITSDCVRYDVIIGQEFLKGVTMLMKDGVVSFFSKDDEWTRCLFGKECDHNYPVGAMSDPEVKSKIQQKKKKKSKKKLQEKDGAKLRQKEESLQSEEVQPYDGRRESLKVIAKQHRVKLQEENRHKLIRSRKKGSQNQIKDLVPIKRTKFEAELKLQPTYLGPGRLTSADQIRQWPDTPG